MDNSIILRAYQPADAAAVRRICFDTALFGRPMQPVFNDDQLIAEALAGYYLRCEPDLTFVADAAGTIAGYISGCADTPRFRRLYARRIAPRLLGLFLVRGHWRRPAVWALLLASARAARASRAVHGGLARDYPAHLHLNLAIAWQRRGLGMPLLDRLLAELRARGIRGVHISASSPGGQAFFARAGFQLLAEYPAPEIFNQPPHRAQLMGLKL